MIRQFSIPYNGHDPKEYLEKISKYSQYIDSIFYGSLTLFENQLTSELRVNDRLEYELNTLEFLKLSRGKYKRLLTLNSMVYLETDARLKNFVKYELSEYVKKTGIDGVIVSDFTMVQLIHKYLPELEIQSSCNSIQWNLPLLNHWRKLGVKVFNTPRDSSRMLPYLRMVKNAGFDIKLLINEACLNGCPNSICHNVLTNHNYCRNFDCILGDPVNVFRSNFVLPRWLSHYDKYIKIYKLSGRFNSTDKIVFHLDAYINERDDLYLDEIANSATLHKLDEYNREKRLANGLKPIRIKTSDIPDKLMTCQSIGCDKCNLCPELFERYRLPTHSMN